MKIKNSSVFYKILLNKKPTKKKNKNLEESKEEESFVNETINRS